MSNPSFQLEVSGLDDLIVDIDKAAAAVPLELEKGLNKIGKQFKQNIKNRAEKAYKTSNNITSGLTVTRVKVEGDKLYSYFKPEAKGNKAHAWHLQEFGYELKRPKWNSRAKAIRYKDAGKSLGWIEGKHIVEKEEPSFLEYMTAETNRLIETILKENNL